MPPTNFDIYQGLFLGVKEFEEDRESLKKGLVRAGVIDRLENIVDAFPANERDNYIQVLRSNPTNPSVLVHASEIGLKEYDKQYKEHGQNNLSGILSSTPIDFFKAALLYSEPTASPTQGIYKDVAQEHYQAFVLKQSLKFIESEKKSGKTSQNGAKALNNIRTTIANYYQKKYTGSQEIIGRFFVEAAIHGADERFPLMRAETLTNDLIKSVITKLGTNLPDYINQAYASEDDKRKMYTQTFMGLYEDNKK